MKNFLLPEPPISVSFNRAPGQSHPIITEKNRKPVWSFADWGLNINTSKSKIRFKPINARIESILCHKIFNKPLRFTRCLIPADGYYEWQSLGYEKYPYYHYTIDKAPFLMAGFYTKEVKSKSFAIITHAAVRNLSHIHHRMPVIVKPDDWNSWLNPNSDLQQMLENYSEPQMKIIYHRVHHLVNKVSENNKELVLPLKEKQSTLW